MSAVGCLSARHRHMLEVESGIAPDVIARRGYYTETDPAALAALGFAPYQCRPGLVIPQWTTAGVQRGYVLRPDNPRCDPKNGKPIKYETPEGSRPRLDVPPDVAAVLRDPSVPLDFTEGSKKADTAVSHGRYCLSLNGVYGFLSGKLVIPDFDDIALIGRRCRVIYDSDVCRKPSVRDALDRLVGALERRGAIVDVVYLPEGPNGAKVGLDDFHVTGGTNAELDALARPWEPNALPFVPDPDDPAEELARLRRERDEAKRALSAAIQVFLNPHLKSTEKVALVATFGLVQQKRERGEVEQDGTVRLSSAEISDDWRPVPEKGEHVAPLNPKDGSRPRMSRDQVRPILKSAIDRGLLPARPRPTVRHRDGASFQDTDWAIAPPASLDTFLAPAAGWCPDKIEPRKPRRQPCPHCQEEHAIVRKDYCRGCGALRHETVIDPPIEPSEPPRTTSGKLSEVKETASIGSPPTPPPRSFVGKSIGGAASVAVDPSGWFDTAPTKGSGINHFSSCLGCGCLLPPGHRYQCRACVASSHAPPDSVHRGAAP